VTTATYAALTALYYAGNLVAFQRLLITVLEKELPIVSLLASIEHAAVVKVLKIREATE
jgi:hypothetical protein